MSFPVPSKEQCFKLMDQFEMLPNIRAHSLLVAATAEHLLLNLYQSPEIISNDLPPFELVSAGALLHDIAKTPCLNRKCRHAERGAELITELGYPEIGNIIAEHIMLMDPDETRWKSGRFTAEEIVYYADKRVKHNTIVSLDERLSYIIKNYAKGNSFIEKKIRENFQLCFQFENLLFAFFTYSPEQLAAQVDAYVEEAAKDESVRGYKTS